MNRNNIGLKQLDKFNCNSATLTYDMVCINFSIYSKNFLSVNFILGEASVEHFGRAFLYSTNIVGECTVPTLTTG